MRLKPLLAKLALVAVSLLVTASIAEIGFRVFVGRKLVYLTTEDTYWEHAPNQKGLVRLRFPPARINRLGFRGPNVEIPKPAEVFRIAALGDSITFGWGVQDDETFCAQMERLLSPLRGKKVEVVNMGVAGYGLFQAVALLEKKGLQLEPNMVVLSLFRGNLIRQPFAANRQKEDFLWKAKIKNLLRRSALLGYLRDKLNVTMAVNENYRSEAEAPSLWVADLERLAALADLCQKAQIPLLLAGIPERVEPDPELKAFLETFATERGILTTTEFPAMREHPEADLLIPDDGHPTPLKHRLIAEELARTIRAWAEVASLAHR